MAMLGLLRGADDRYDVIIGLSLSLNSTDTFLKVPSQDIECGLRLLEAWVVQRKPFRHIISGIYPKFRIEIQDDRGNRAEAVRLYRDMVNKRRVDLFLGPYSETLSTAVGEVLTELSRTAMLHSYGIVEHTQPPRSPDNPGLFSPDVPVEKVLLKGVSALRERGAGSMVLVSSENTRSFQWMCESTRASATQQGYKILASFTFQNTALASRILQNVSALQPDVLVLCAPPSQQETLIHAAKNVKLSTRAILASGVNSVFLFERNGPSLFSQLLTTSSWHRDANLSCIVFGTNKVFVDEYYKRCGKYPADYVASAVGGSIALMNAASKFELQGATLANQQNLAKILRTEKVQSLLGPLQFNIIGTSKYATAKLMQLNMTHDYGLVANLIPESSALAIKWPMESWEERNVYSMACQMEGYAPDTNFRKPSLARSELEATCTPCPPGKSIFGRSDVCYNCSEGSYSNKEGSACKRCPQGASCAMPGLSEPGAAKNYYMLKETANNDLKYIRCNPQSICIGDNECTGDNFGVLCRNCKEGYTSLGPFRDGFECSKCVPPSGLVVALLIYFMFNLWLGRLCCVGEPSMQTHLIKRLISYSQLCAIATLSGDLKSFVPEFRICSYFIVLPFQTILGPDCLFARVVNPLSEPLDPKELSQRKVVFTVLFSLLWLLSKIVLTIVTVCVTTFWKWAREHRRQQGRRREASVRVWAMKALRRCARWSIFWMYLYFCPVTMMLISGLEFNRMDTYRLRHFPDVTVNWELIALCLSCLITFSILIPALIAYSLWRKSPGRQRLKMEEMRERELALETEGTKEQKGVDEGTNAKQEEQKNIEQQEAEKKDAQEWAKLRNLMGFLYADFHPDHWYYEGLFVLFKLMFMLCLLMPNVATKNFLMLACLSLHTLMFVRVMPFVNRDKHVLPRLESCCIFSVMSILLLQTYLTWNLASPAELEVQRMVGVDTELRFDLVVWIMYVEVWGCHIFFALTLLLSFYMALIFRHVALKSQAVPESLSMPEWWILKSVKVRHLRWSSTTQMLDVSDLKSFERRELLGILNVTLSVFITNGRVFNPCHMIIALERAMKSCISKRRARIEKAHPLIMAQLRIKGVLGFLKYWFPSLLHEQLAFVAGDGDEEQDISKQRGKQDPKAARLERHSLLKARRKCSTSTATMEELQDALHKQHRHIEHGEEELFGHKALPHDFEPHGETRRAHVSDRRHISMAPRQRRAEPLDIGVSPDVDSWEIERLQTLANEMGLSPEGSREDLIRRLKAPSPTTLDKLLVDQSSIPLKVEQLRSSSQSLREQAAKLQTQKNRLLEELRAVTAQLKDNSPRYAAESSQVKPPEVNSEEDPMSLFR
eukprot:TRINITY_DN18236_c0_g5_i1.p1 TRINITY_DN18236_c0_g5~~TRINITY_DN18236_c0_g5_i1.p1  ORF type:complete len:1369 (+),score=151.47 TRINITY_DN18236_c0_g5_i1:64-4107(+)